MDSHLPADAIIMQCDTGAVSMADLEAAISPAWLSRALAVRYPGVAVEAASITRVFAGCSVKIWTKMVFNEAGQRANLPATMVVKTGFNRHDPIMLFTYETEMQAYRDILPLHPIHSPICYYAGPSPDGESAAVIIEDLLPRNVRFCHAQTPLNYDEAAAFLDAMAKFHATSWNKPDMLDGSSPIAQRAAITRAGLADYMNMLMTEESWAQYTGMARGAAVSQIFHNRSRFLQAFGNMVKFGETQDKTILMGDEHLGNLYIEADGTPGFLDFQSIFEPWCRGIAYFISNALDCLDRRAWERRLVAHYLDRLTAYGIKAPSFEAGYDAYCRYLLFPYFVFLTNGAHFQTEAVNTAYAARAAFAMIDNSTYARLGV